MNTKICSKCKKCKPVTITYFGKRKKEKDGFRRECKQCRILECQNRKEKILEYSKEYLKRPGIKEKRKQYSKEYGQRHEVKDRKRKYFQENKETISKSRKRYREENKNKISENNKQYRKDNIEKLNLYRQDNKEKIIELGRVYYQKNKLKLLANAENYRRNNQDKIKRYRKKNKKRLLSYIVERNAKKLNQTPEYANIHLIRKIYEKRPDGYHVDHMKPLSKGGLHLESNLCYLPATINQSKSSKSIEEFGVDKFNKNVIYWQEFL